MPSKRPIALFGRVDLKRVVRPAADHGSLAYIWYDRQERIVAMNCVFTRVPGGEIAFFAPLGRISASVNLC